MHTQVIFDCSTFLDDFTMRNSKRNIKNRVDLCVVEISRKACNSICEGQPFVSLTAMTTLLIDN